MLVSKCIGSDRVYIGTVAPIEEGWDIMSGTAIEDTCVPGIEPKIEIRFHHCDLEFSGSFAKMIRDLGFMQDATTENADGTRSIFYKLR